MTSIYIEIEPEDMDLQTFSILESFIDESIEHGRFIKFSGKPHISGTYRYTDINFHRDGNRIALPNIAFVTIRETDSNPEEIGQLSYIESYSDDELGIKEPDQFYADVGYPYTQFEKAWDLICNVGIGTLRVTVGIKAPKTDISGYEAILDVSKTNTWPINTLCILRHEKRT